MGGISIGDYETIGIEMNYCLNAPMVCIASVSFQEMPSSWQYYLECWIHNTDTGVV